jgi:hypothetical protein
MNIVFHCLIGAGIAHVAAAKLTEHGGGARRQSDLRVIACAAAAAFLSHGVLDGLKHGYPFPAGVDVFLGASIAVYWRLAVRPRFLWLFSAAFVASVLPDLIDQLPALVQMRLGIDLHLEAGRRIFPWHWADGSGSMYPSSAGAAQFAVLDHGWNRAVSAANHAIVLAIAGLCIAFNPAVFRSRNQQSE